jgi:uncharacterized protein
MRYWPWWLGGLALTAVSLAHWFLLRRMFAVSSRVNALVDDARARLAGEAPMSQDELEAALAAATRDEFGVDVQPAAAKPPARHDLLFVLGIMGGGLLAALTTGSFRPGGISGELFQRCFGRSLDLQLATLLAGGVLVGFGTRMAGGCTSGHGLSGLSRLQPGSALATVAFFGTAAAVSLLLGAW